MNQGGAVRGASRTCIRRLREVIDGVYLKTCRPEQADKLARAVEFERQVNIVSRERSGLSVRPKQQEAMRRDDGVGRETPLRAVGGVVAEEITAQLDRRAASFEK